MKSLLKRAITIVSALALCYPSPAWSAVVSGGVSANIGGTDTTKLTATSPTACTSIEVNQRGYLNEIIDGSGQGQSVVLTVYDEGTSPTCSAADQLYAVTLLTGQIITLNVRLYKGLAYKLSAAPNSNIIINRI